MKKVWKFWPFMALKNLFGGGVRLWAGLLRLSFLVSLAFAAWGAFVVAPKQIDTWYSKSIDFTYEEKQQFKEELLAKYPGTTLEDADKYAENIVHYFFGGGWWLHEGVAFQVRQSICGDRDGKISAHTRSEIVNRAVNRIIDEHDWIDFSGGAVVQNKAYGLKPFLCSEDDFSIVPGFNQRFFTALRLGISCGFLAWLTVVTVLPIVLLLLRWGIKMLCRNLRWIGQGFSGK